MGNAVKIILMLVILGLVYLVFESIMRPVRFNKELDRRSKVVIESLKDLRTAEITFKQIHGRYTKNFDTLIDFLRKGKIPVVNIKPDPTDTTFTRTINDTIGYITVADSLFKKRENFSLDDIRYIPFTNKEPYKLDAGTIKKGGVNVNVFEIAADYDIFLADLNKQLVVNLIAKRETYNKYPGIKVGSMVEASTDGNWE
jgi:hypothetical protein